MTRVSFPNPYGFPLPDEGKVLELQRACGFSDAYRDFLLTQNGFSFRALERDPAGEAVLRPAEEALHPPADLALLYGLGAEDRNAALETNLESIFDIVFLPVGVGYGGDLFVEILAGRHKGNIASIDHELHASSDSLGDFLSDFELDGGGGADALADALCDADLGLVRLHATSMAEFTACCIHCDAELQGFVLDAPSMHGVGGAAAGFAPQMVRFAEIRHLLPADCWAVWRNGRRSGEFDDEPVAVIEGQLTLDALNLDDPLGTGAHVFLIFVRGDLTVRRAIGNENTDGASGLIVAGNLSCRDCVVGGQQIYVTGDLTVSELFWGDYNHGELIVAGDVAASMFIVTDGYDFTIRGERKFGRWILDEKEGGDAWRLDDADALGEFIDPALLLVDDESVSLWREKILAAARGGQAVIQPDTPDGTGQTARALFPDSSITPRNILRVGAPELLYEGGDDNAIGMVEFWSGDIFCRISRLPDGRKEPETKIYLQLDERLAVLIGLFNTPPSLWKRITGVLRTLSGKPPIQHPGMIWTDLEAADGWRLLDERSPPDVRDLLRRGWDVALAFVATRERLRAAIPVKQLHDLLALPLVEPYDDFYSDERNGLWVGRTYCSFRQEGARPGKPALLRVTVEADDTQLYFYEAARMADGSEALDVRFAEELGDDDYAYPGLTGGPQLDRAIRLFATAQRNLAGANAELLAGVPVGDDGFALKHWRRKGYLKGRTG